jgi:lipopolysaccharide biosynthesis glycosyltransferase
LTEVSVAFICDHTYALPTGVAVSSLICNRKPDTVYDIYIIASNLTQADIAIFRAFTKPHVKIHIIEASSEKYRNAEHFGHISTATYLKFELPDLLLGLDKVLYLDGDVIIQRDLAELFDMNIENFNAAAVKDIGLIHNVHNIKNYVNTGVLLLNLKRMRKQHLPATLMETVTSAKDIHFMDQDCFNIVLKDSVKHLPLRFNCPCQFLQQHKNEYPLDFINTTFKTDYASWQALKQDAVIVHWITHTKPWLYHDVALARRWDEYFHQSPFHDSLLKRRSVKLYAFIASQRLTNLVYIFFCYWRQRGIKFSLQKAKRTLMRSLQRM